MLADDQPERQKRRSIRLNGYDYTQAGGYFVTVVAHLRKCRFGEIAGERMMLNRLGKIVQACWEAIPAHYPDVEADAFVVMPNHVHGIIFIHEYDIGGAQHAAPLQKPHPALQAPSPNLHALERVRVRLCWRG